MTTIQADDSDAVLEQPRTRVLLATDGAAASLDAAKTIRDNLRDAEVVVVSVVDGRSVADEAEACRIVDRTCMVLARPARRVVRRGGPVAEICEVVEAEDIDVVAIGAPSRRLRLRAGVAELLLRRLDREVLVVPPAGDRQVV